MSKELQSRTEHSRSIEDAEKYRALDTLKEVGLLVPLTELETFHGRVSTTDKKIDWAVDPLFTNGSDDSGNNNINNRPTLYSGEEEIARDFAAERRRGTIRPIYNKLFQDKVRGYTPELRQDWLDRLNKQQKDWWEGLPQEQRRRYTQTEATVYTLDELSTDRRVYSEAKDLEGKTPEEEKQAAWEDIAQKYRAEVHEIVTADTDATVLDFSFNEAKLDDEALEKYKQALKVLAISVTDGSPVSFNNRDTVQPFVAAMNRLKKHVVLSSEVVELATEAGINERAALQLASTFNSRQIIQVRPSYLVSELIKHPTDIFTDSLEVNGERQELPINLEYVQRFLREAHIVGVKQNVNSATLGRDITSVSFLDLEKTVTAKELEAERQAIRQRLGGMAAALSQLSDTELQSSQPLLRLLEDAHAKPDKLVDAAKKIEGYEAIFDGDTGNWEGFTLAEHTETVLRNFDENYADGLPVELLAPMRLAMLAHDVGKPIAAARGEKHKQKEYNVAQADDFLGKLGVDDGLKGLLLAVIGDGEELAFQIDVRGAGQPAQTAMRELAIKTLSQFYGTENISDEQVGSFTEMCKILQMCDGGAYTSMAITSRQGAKGRHRNAPSFNASFAQPVGFGRRGIRLTEEGDVAAAPDLTPQGSENASRLRISHRGSGRKAPKLTT